MTIGDEELPNDIWMVSINDAFQQSIKGKLLNSQKMK